MRGSWEAATKEDYALRLRTVHGLEPAKRRHETASEVDKALIHVQSYARIDGVAPKIYSTEDLFIENGKRYLNNSRVRAMQPAATPQEYGINFPWLGEFFDTCWDHPIVCQKEHCFDWWRRFYVSALQGDLEKGLALFLGGPVDCGKTLTTFLIGESVGGKVPADSFLLNETTFNKEMLEAGLWVVDDAAPARDTKVHERFSENVKKFVANTLFNYHAKFRDAAAISWDGRLVVAFNDNEIGIRMVPALEQSIEDKLMLLRFRKPVRPFPSRQELRAIIRRELPFFLRWLLDWTPPQRLQDGGRFGKNYIHPKLRLLALRNSGLSDFFGIIEIFGNRCVTSEWCRENGFAEKKWCGSSANLFAALTSDDVIRPLLKSYTPASLGKRLSQACQVPGTGVRLLEKSSHKGKSPRFEISFPEEDEERTRVVSPLMAVGKPCPTQRA